MPVSRIQKAASDHTVQVVGMALTTLKETQNCNLEG